MNLATGIPTVDAREIEFDLHRFGQSLGQAWTGTGFVAVTDHGIDTAVIENCMGAARSFFELPEETKMKYCVEGGGGQRGYTPLGVETAKNARIPDRKEFWHVGRNLPSDDPLRSIMPDNLWPEDVSNFQDSCAAFYSEMDHLGRRLLAAVAMYLGQESNFFESRVAGGNSILRLLHYPPCDTPEPGERAAAHQDINVITLLVGADQAGLEILRRDGQWVPVHADSSAIVCNVGDMLERVTNQILPSTTHRVIRPAGSAAGISRYSMPYFLHFAPDVVIETLPGCATKDNPNRYPEPITAQAFLERRLAEIGLT